jgi:hypothetical protein
VLGGVYKPVFGLGWWCTPFFFFVGGGLGRSLNFCPGFVPPPPRPPF